MEEFVYRTYGKGELAQLYAPAIGERAACKKLLTWIKRNAELHDALLRSGLTPHSKEYTPLSGAADCRCVGGTIASPPSHL